MKYVILIPDGAADYPVQSLGGKTPLQVARKPNIDRLAGRARCGLFRSIPENFLLGSEIANLSILGYDPKLCYQGRGVLEAAAMGVKLGNTDVALRCNTICIENERIKNHSAGHISSEEAAALIRMLNEKLGTAEVEFHPGLSYRHLLILKSRYSPELVCAPPHDHVGEPVSELLVRAKTPSGQETAELLNNLILESQKILKNHPVNIRRAGKGQDQANSIWPWSPGRKPQMATFQERFGLKGAVISAVDLVKGLGVYSGFDVINVEGATGFSDTNYEGKAEACLKALTSHDLVYVHVEAADEASHDGNLDLKIRCIEDFDRRLLGNILPDLDWENTSIGLLPDHPTPVETRGHTADPVPFLIYKPGVQPDRLGGFDEESCKRGSYGLLEKDGFVQALLSSSKPT